MFSLELLELEACVS